LIYKKKLAIQRRHQPTWAKYLIGFAAALVASSVTILFREDLTPAMFVAFWPAVIFTAWFCGLGPSLVVSGIAILVVDYFVLTPRSAGGIGDVVPLGLFLLISTVVNALAVSADQSRERAETVLTDLADRARLLEEQAGELEMQREELRSLADELEDSVAELEAANRGAEGARKELSDVLTALPDATIVYDRKWQATFLNPAAASALRCSGIDPQIVLGRTMWEVFGEQAAQLRAGALRVEETGAMIDFEHQGPMNDRWYHHRLLKTNSGYLVHSRDVTDERRAEADERAARLSAEAANRAKSNFLAVMSHELRTPLNAIAGYVELMEMGLRGPITDEQRTDLSRIRRSQVNLLALIDAVLQFARIETGRLMVEPTAVTLDLLLGDMRTFIEPQLIERRQHFEYHGCGPDVTIDIDGEKLGQIVINLLSNAVKFTAHGGTIQLACAVVGDDVEISVSDNGRGIDAGDLERIFEPFVQVEMGPTRTVAGTGLGLAISRDLAQAMGGTISVESTPGAGSVFTIRLPRYAARIGRLDPMVPRVTAASH
jgi:signal transduction histidine kinase